MNNNNFNANELNIVSVTLDKMEEAYGKLETASYGGGSSSDEVASIIKSEDSDLADAWKNASEISHIIYQKSVDLVAKINQELTKYAQETLKNESVTAEAVASVNSSLEANKEALSQLDF